MLLVRTYVVLVSTTCLQLGHLQLLKYFLFKSLKTCHLQALLIYCILAYDLFSFSGFSFCKPILVLPYQKHDFLSLLTIKYYRYETERGITEKHTFCARSRGVRFRFTIVNLYIRRFNYIEGTLKCAINSKQLRASCR